MKAHKITVAAVLKPCLSEVVCDEWCTLKLETYCLIKNDIAVAFFVSSCVNTCRLITYSICVTTLKTRHYNDIIVLSC